MSDARPFAGAFVAFWFADFGVSSLSPEARLLWLEICGRCCQSGRDELEGSPARLAELLRVKPWKIKERFAELTECGCASVEYSEDGQTVRVRPKTGMDGVTETPETASAAPSAAPSVPAGVTYPETVEEVLSAAESVFYMMSRWEAEKFLAENRAMNWNIRGTVVRNWKALLLKWKERQTPEQRRAAIEERRPPEPEKPETSEADELAAYLKSEAEAQKNHVARPLIDLAKK